MSSRKRESDVCEGDEITAKHQDQDDTNEPPVKRQKEGNQEKGKDSHPDLTTEHTKQNDGQSIKLSPRSQSQVSKASIPGDFEAAEDFQDKAVEGDLIEIDRGLYKHWALYVGDGMVINVTGPSGDISAKEAQVKKMTLLEVAGDSRIRVNNLEKSASEQSLEAFKPETVLQNATDLLGKTVPYNVLSRNCEHYVTKWKYGKEWSEQARSAMMMLQAFSGVSPRPSPESASNSGNFHKANASANGKADDMNSNNEDSGNNVSIEQNTNIAASLLSVFATAVSNHVKNQSEQPSE